jgi:hypothetical protein
MPTISVNSCCKDRLLQNSRPLPTPLLDSGVPGLLLMATTGAPAVIVVIAVMTAATSAVMGAVMIARSTRDVVAVVEIKLVAVAVAVAVAALPRGLMQPARFATRRGTMPRIAGPDTPMMMIMVTKRCMPRMVLTPIGTKILVPPTTLLENSTI